MLSRDGGRVLYQAQRARILVPVRQHIVEHFRDQSVEGEVTLACNTRGQSSDGATKA